MVTGRLAALVFAAVPSAVSAQPAGVLDAATLFKRCSPSIVTIETPDSIGSGVIIDAGGIIVTNLHVIRGRSQVRISLPGGTTFEAPTVMGVDAQRDLAVLRVTATGLPALPLGDPEALAIGSVVYAIGTPKGFELTLSQGLLSGVRMRDDYKVLQTTAPISPGSSGGALLDDHGRLVGITTFQIQESQNLNFAVPVTYLKGLLSGPALTLAEFAAKFPPEGQGNPQNSGSPAPPDGVPTLAKVYAASNGSAVSFEQKGAEVDATFLTPQGAIYGRTAFKWDPARSIFAGAGAVQTACAGTDGKPLVVEIEEELHPVDARTIRNRWTRPVMNCLTKQVQDYKWDETLWFMVDQ